MEKHKVRKTKTTSMDITTTKKQKVCKTNGTSASPAYHPNSITFLFGQVTQDDHSLEYVDSPRSPCESVPSYSYPSEEFNEEKFHLLSRKYAEIALDCYNKEHRTKYEVVEGIEDLCSYGFLYDELLVHCNFRAANPKKMPFGEYSSSTKATAADKGPSSELFFAELFVVSPDEFKVTCCCILEGGEAFPSCMACEENISQYFNLKHPIGGFLRGCKQGPYALHSVLNKAPESTQTSKQLQLGHVALDDHDPEYVDSPHSPCESYSYPSEEFNEEKFHLLSREYAEIAMDYYNKEHRTNYKVVEGIEDLCSYGFLYDELWVHCNFRAAKLKKTPSSELFFAELFVVRPNELKVTCCCILKGGKAFPNCMACEDNISQYFNLKHPIGGFRGGCKRRSYALRSLSRASD